MKTGFTYDMGDYITELGCILINLKLIHNAISENDLSTSNAAEAVFAAMRQIERIYIDMENLNEKLIREGKL